MKKVLSFIAAMLLFVSCSQTKIVDVASEYLGSPASSVNDINKYENLEQNQLFVASKELKERIDKELGMLPTTSEKMGRRVTGHICENYKWESPERFVSLWIDYTENSVEIIDRAK